MTIQFRDSHRQVAALAAGCLALTCLLFYWMVHHRGYDYFDEGVFLLSCLPDQEMGGTLSHWYVYCRAIFDHPDADIVTYRLAKLALAMLTGLFIGVSFSRWMSHRFSLGWADHIILIVLTVFANILSAGFGMITYYVFINVALLAILGCFFNLDVTRSGAGRLFYYVIIGFAISTAAFVSAPFALANLVMSFTLAWFCTKKQSDSLPTVGAALLLGGVSGTSLFFVLHGNFQAWMQDISTVLDAMGESTNHNLSYYIEKNHRYIGLSVQWFVDTFAPFALLAIAGHHYLVHKQGSISRSVWLMLGAASLLLLNLAIKAIVDFNYSELVLSILFVSMLIYVSCNSDRSSMNTLSRRSIASLTIAGAVFVALYHLLMQTYSSYTYILLYPTYIAVCIVVLLLLWRATFFNDLNFQRLLFLYLLVAPLTAVFGSSNDLIAGATKYLAPWYILVMYLAYAGSFQPPARAKRAGALSAVVVLLCLLSLTQVFYVQGIKPYHLSTTMLRQTESITPPGRLAGLRVDREVAEFYGTLTSLLQPQLERNRGILNLTQKPSVVYAVGGHAVGQLYYDRRGVFSERLCRYLQSKIGQTKPVIFTEITIDAIQPPTARCLERIDIDLEQDYRLLQRFKWPNRKKNPSFFYVYVHDAT